MKLYHGSNVKVVYPNLNCSKPFKDFGQGFYLSAEEPQAKAQALSKVDQMRVGEPIVNTFLFDEALLTSGELNVLVFDDYSIEWAEFVLMNRDSKIAQPSHDYDIVYGPIADDGVNYQLRRYWGGVITLPKLIEELRYAKGITFQYFFGTERALKTLKALCQD
ncbi:MAG: DUF3990 domain-containing protein [Bacteroidales bacterium]|nr:DUF3990 domain-containing protein [Bacteroidales bacterium]